MMEGGFHKLAIKDENVLDQLQRQFRNVYDETQNTEFGTDAHEILRRGRIRLTYVQPPVTVDDINVPEPTEDGDDVQARVTAWSGLPPPGELLSQYEVASAAPGCLCLRRQGKEEVSVVMLEFRPRAMLEDCIPLSKEAADFLLQFRTDPPADPAMEPLRLVYSFYSSEWPQEEMAMCSYAPEVHFYPDGSCGLRRLEHIARTTMIPTCFDAPDVPGWLAIRVHSDGVFVCRDYFCTYDERQDAEELMLELHEEFEELRQPLPTLPQAQQQAEQQAAQQQAQQPEQQGTQQQQQQQQPQPRGRRRQRQQQQQQRQQQSQQQPQIQQAQQPDQQPGAAAGPAGAAGAGAGPEVWPSFRPATYLGALDGFRKQCNWRMSGTIFAALHLNSSVLTEGGSTVIKEVQAGFLGRGPADKGDLTVHYGGTFAGGRFTRGTSTSTLHFRINKNTVKMTALKYLVRAMHGGQLPPEDSWLALVRHQDGSISAHIWLKESKEAEMLKQYDVKLTPVIKAAQLQEAARLQAEQPTAQDGAAAGQAQAQPPQAPAAQVAASSGSDAQQDAQDGDGSSSEEEEEEGSQAAEEEEEGADEEEVEAALQQAEPAARAAGWAGAAVAPAAEAAATAGPAEEAPEGSEEEAEEGNVGSAEAGAAVPSAAESSDESRAAAALGLLRQDPAAVVGPRPVQKQTRQEKEASRLAAARHQAQAREEAGSRSRDARALARRQTAEAQQRKRGAEQEPGPSQPPSKRQQREKRRAAAAAAAAAGAAGGSGAVASTGPSASRPPPKQAQLQAAKRQRTGQQQQQQESPASLGQQVPPNRQQPVGGEAIVQQQEQQQQGQQLRRRPGRPKKQKGPQAMARQQEPPANELGEQQQQQQREQEEQEQQQAQLQQQEQQAAGAAAAGAEQPAGAAAAAAGVDEPQAQLPPCVLQLLQDVLGSRPGVIASLASYLVSQGLSMFSDLGHLTDSELVAGTAGLTSLLVRRLRWVWFARGWGEQQQLTAEEVTLLEHDYEAMQEFYAMGAWS